MPEVPDVVALADALRDHATAVAPGSSKTRAS